jgi:hypothetical protein
MRRCVRWARRLPEAETPRGTQDIKVRSALEVGRRSVSPYEEAKDDWLTIDFP